MALRTSDVTATPGVAEWAAKHELCVFSDSYWIHGWRDFGSSFGRMVEKDRAIRSGFRAAETLLAR